MADNNITVVGNVTRDPELMYLQSGTAKLNIGMACNRRFRKNDEWQEETSFFDVVAWRDLADNVAESISKGDRIIVSGRIDQRSWETDQGEKRSKIEIVADEIGPSLRWATASPKRTQRNNNGAGAARNGGGSQQSNSAPAAPAAAYDDANEPF